MAKLESAIREGPDIGPTFCYRLRELFKRSAIAGAGGIFILWKSNTVFGLRFSPCVGFVILMIFHGGPNKKKTDYLVFGFQIDPELSDLSDNYRRPHQSNRSTVCLFAHFIEDVTHQLFRHMAILHHTSLVDCPHAPS